MAAQDPFFGQEPTSLYEPVVIQGMGSGSTMPEPFVRPFTPPEGTETYIVQKGDMLSKLAIEFDTTVATLVRMNNLSNPDVLYVGQELRVPPGRAKSRTVAKSPGSIAKGGTYTIQKGDTLSGIALAAGVSIDDLRSLNNIKGDKIMAGDSLDIPSYGKVPSAERKAPAAAPARKAEPAAPAPAPLAPVEPQIVPMGTGSMALDMVEDHTLYPGETLDDLARQYGVSKSEIMRLNNISSESQIREGQRLRIPIAE